MKFKSQLVPDDIGNHAHHYYSCEGDDSHPLLIREAGDELSDEHLRVLEESINRALPLIEAAHACEATACDVRPLLSMLNSSLCANGVRYSWDGEAVTFVAEPADHEDFEPDDADDRLWLTRHFSELTTSRFWNELHPGEIQSTAERVARRANRNELAAIAEALNQAERELAARQITHAAAFIRGALTAKG